MADRLVLALADDGQLQSLRDRAAVEILSWEMADEGARRHADLVIDGCLGPLSLKRAHLQMIAQMGGKRILTASVTATIRAQERWIASSEVHLIGYDPLLMRAQGTRQTVVAANSSNLLLLESLWPDTSFISVRDAVGLIFSREILPLINEAVAFVARGYEAHAVDRGMRLGLNYPMGPMAWADLFGWQSVYYGLLAMQDMYGERFRPHPWIRSQLGSSLLDREDELCGK